MELAMCPYNGLGVFNLPIDFNSDAANGIKILSTRQMTNWNDVATNGLTNCITKDGQTTPTANIPLGGFKLTGVGDPTAAGDALVYGTTAANAVLINSGKPCFLAYSNAVQTNQTGNGAGAAPSFNTEVFDRGGNFAANTFVAPVTGIYRLTACVLMSAVDSTMTFQRININTTAQVFTAQQELTPTGTGTLSLKIDVLANMTATDQASVSVELDGGAGNTASIFGQAAAPRYTFFCGELVA